jgi:hypothetical protein
MMIAFGHASDAAQSWGEGTYLRLRPSLNREEQLGVNQRDLTTNVTHRFS